MQAVQLKLMKSLFCQHASVGEVQLAQQMPPGAAAGAVADTVSRLHCLLSPLRIAVCVASEAAVASLALALGTKHHTAVARPRHQVLHSEVVVLSGVWLSSRSSAGTYLHSKQFIAVRAQVSMPVTTAANARQIKQTPLQQHSSIVHGVAP